MEREKSKTYEVVGKHFVKVTSKDKSINFIKQHVRLEIYVDDKIVPMYIRLCSTLVDINQVDQTILEFPTHG